ncbi:LCP family protein [Eubacteriaceae bacterium ES3]|nr:LCP family protein [Eubacteriaceae bacterium ES3]
MSKQNKGVIGNRRNQSSQTSARQSGNAKRSMSNDRTTSTRPTRVTSSKKNTSSKSVRKRKSSSNLFKKFLRTAILVLICLIGSGVLVNAFYLNNVNSGLSGNLRKYGISSTAAAYAKDHKIVNIAVFGIDGREDVEGDRTDTIMIATADFENDALKVTSLMRDTYAYIDEDYDFDKLNAAYAYGGADLAIQTINQNFDTAITDYITVDFTSMVTIVNAVGGVTIDIETEDELYWVNAYLDDVNAKVATSSPYLEDTGSQVVDGSQALAYCRVRYVGDGDFDRTLRQRVVFEQAVSKALDLSPQQQYTLLTELMPYIETSLSTSEFLKYGLNTLLMHTREIEQARFPADDAMLLDYVGDSSFVIPDTLADNIKELYAFIYNDETYEPSEQAAAISEQIKENIYGDSYDDYYDYSEDYSSNDDSYDTTDDYYSESSGPPDNFDPEY